MPGIFISYRREDSPGHAGRLFDRLGATFGRDRVFMDVSAIEAGLDFVETIERAVGSCDVLLAVIGREWADCKDHSGRRRLDNQNDFIRIEIATGLSRNVRVIPVLVRGAPMPDADALPPDLKRLTRRQAVELRDTRWDADVDDLIVVLQNALATAPGVPAGVPGERSTGPPVVSEALVPPAVQVGKPTRRGRLLAAAAVLVLLIGAALLQYGPRILRTGPSGSTATPTPGSTDKSGTSATPTNEQAAMRVPNLVGVGLEEAGGLIAAAGFKLGPIERQTTEAAAPGTVIRQTPAPGAELTPGTAVAIVVAAKPAPAPDTTIEVPSIVGEPLDQAAERIRKAGLVVGSRKAESRRGAARFVVLAQMPTGGSRAERGTRIDIVYARPGPSVPDIVGVPLDDAKAKLRAMGFEVGQLTVRRTNNTPARQVLSQSPQPGSEQDAGTPINLTYAEPLPTEGRRLPAPVADTPACGSRIARPPASHNLVLGWNTVPGAASYTVEVDCFGCAGKGWYSARGTPWHVRENLGRRSPIYSSDLAQAPGSALRWRVWAIDPAGERGEMSGWCQVSFE